MGDRWMEEREGRGRSERYGRRYEGPAEARSFDNERYDTPRPDVGARFGGPNRDRVFGERDTGAEYNTSNVTRGGGMRFQNQDYTRGGRFYGDDGRQPIYRSEYGQGGREYGAVPRGYDAEPQTRSRYDNAEQEHRYSREPQRPMSGGTGGYDFERGYGDGGRERSSGGPSWQDRHYSGASPAFYRQGFGGERSAGYRQNEDHGGRFEDYAYQAGQGLRRAGERISAFLGGMDRRDGHPERDRYDEPRRYATDFGREERWIDHSGRGPKNYKRGDERIKDEVCQRLTDDPWLDASQIDVNVSAGEVTLSGSVDNREAKRRAERLVEDLAGVSNVQNDLRIGATGLTGAGRGFGDSVLEAQMRGEATGDGSAMSRSPTRRS